MEQHAEVKSEVKQIQKRIGSKRIKRDKKLDTKINVHAILAAPDYLYVSPAEFMNHFTNLYTNEKYDHWHKFENFTMIMGYANRSLFETCLSYFKQKNEDFVIATTPLNHTSWRNAIEKYAKPGNIHVINLNDKLNGLGEFPDTDRCDIIVITHLFGQDFDLKGLSEFKKRTGAVVMEDRVQGGTLDVKFSHNLMDISTYSMAQDKRPIAFGGAFLYIRNYGFDEMITYLIETIANYPPEPVRKRLVELLKKIPTYLLYNRKGAIRLFLIFLKAFNLNLLDFTNTYRKSNPGFAHADFNLKPSPGLLKSMSQHYTDHKNMENLFEEKYMLFRSYLSEKIINRYFPWYRDASLTPYNTIYVEKSHVEKFLLFMNKSDICIIWNPTYKMFNFEYKGNEKYQKFFDGFIYLPCLAIMSNEEIHYLADRIEKFDEIISK
ncbi:MAG: hypothetical protein ACTSRE_11215 [Promethearchaeota archaeon]